MYGKSNHVPRLTMAFGDAGISYRFAGTTIKATPWLPWIADYRDRIEESTGGHFNVVLINYYRDGQDYVGWHADDEKDMVSLSMIASLSVGATRDFQMKRCPIKGQTTHLIRST